jgi:hypothetical protein
VRAEARIDESTWTCTLVVPAADRSRVLAIVDGTDVRLPSVRVPRGWVSGRVEECAAAAREQLRIDVVVLRDLVAPEGQALCEATLTGDLRSDIGLAWVDAMEVRERILEAEIRSVLAEVGAVPDPRRAPWERAGWHSGAADWFGEVLVGKGLHVTESPVQVKGAWSQSCVLRAEAGGRRWFLKAVGKKPPAETAVLPLLAERFPDAVPTIVAVDPERRWMVLEDFGPTMADDDWDGMARALGEFARMQMAIADDLDAFAAAGCPDDRAAKLPQSLAELGERHADLGADRLRPFIDATKRELDRLTDAATIPDSIVHQDLRVGNIAMGARGPVIYDWSDTVLAHPFFSAVRFLEFVADTLGEIRFAQEEPTDARRKQLRDAYLAPWADAYGWDGVRIAFSSAWRLQAPFLAVRWEREIASSDPDGAWAVDMPNWVVACCDIGTKVLASDDHT